jgi:hypothetical protein
MNLLCLKCASANCTCGRLALTRLHRELCGEEVIDAGSEPVLGSIDCAAERGSAELKGLFVLKLRYDS